MILGCLYGPLLGSLGSLERHTMAVDLEVSDGHDKIAEHRRTWMYT